jgi:hypothetical protein
MVFVLCLLSFVFCLLSLSFILKIPEVDLGPFRKELEKRRAVLKLELDAPSPPAEGSQRRGYV